jgi:hypothetical protein
MKISKYHRTKARLLHIDDPTQGMGNIWYQGGKRPGKINVVAAPCGFVACPAGVFGLNGPKAFYMSHTTAIKLF